MKRIAICLLLMISGISGYGQERIRELAREMWNTYPTECVVAHIHFFLHLPKRMVDESLLNRTEDIFSQSISSADRVSVVKDPTSSEVSLSYQLFWDQVVENGQSSYSLENIGAHKIPEWITEGAIFEVSHDSIYFAYIKPIFSKWNDDLSEFESFAKETIRPYKYKTKPFRFLFDKADEEISGTEYIVKCHADSICRLLGKYAMQEYWFTTDNSEINVTYRPQYNSTYTPYSNPYLSLLLYDTDPITYRKIFVKPVSNEQLMIVDVKSNTSKALHDYIQIGMPFLLEPKYFGDLKKYLLDTTTIYPEYLDDFKKYLQDTQTPRKRKKLFSSTYVFDWKDSNKRKGK